MGFNISIALHIIGIVMWMGGLMILTRFMKLSAEGTVSAPGFTAMLKRVYFGFGVGGCALTVLTGLYQLMTRGFGFYFSQGWFHGKITLVLVALVVTAVIGTLVKAVEAGRSVSKGRVIACHALMGTILLLVVFATILGRVG